MKNMRNSKIKAEYHTTSALCRYTIYTWFSHFGLFAEKLFQHHVAVLNVTTPADTVKINIYKNLDKAAEVGSDQRLSASGINGTNTQTSNLKQHTNTATSFVFRRQARPLVSHLDLHLQTTSNFLKYNKCRISLTCSRGEWAHTVYIKELSGEAAAGGEGKKGPFNDANQKWDPFSPI